MSFSERMKQARLNKNMTLKELGKKIGKTEATVQRYESGEIKNLKNDTIELIASALEISPAYLMGWIDENPVNENVHRIAAHIDGDVSEEELSDIIKYIDFIKSQHKD